MSKFNRLIKTELLFLVLATPLLSISIGEISGDQAWATWTYFGVGLTYLVLALFRPVRIMEVFNRFGVENVVAILTVMSVSFFSLGAFFLDLEGSLGKVVSLTIMACGVLALLGSSWASLFSGNASEADHG